jgi:hypothetical protein
MFQKLLACKDLGILLCMVCNKKEYISVKKDSKKNKIIFPSFKGTQD